MRIADFIRAGRIAKLPRAAQWGALFVAAMLLLGLMTLLRFPAALLIGPMLAAIAFGVSGATVRVPARLHQLAQGVAGCLIAQYLTPDILVSMGDYWPTVLLFVALTLAAACLVGWLVSRLVNIDPELSVWGFLPGMAGAVIAMSHERGLDSRTVAFIQMTRLLTVIVVMTLVSRALMEGHPAGLERGDEETIAGGGFTTLAVAAIGPLIAWLAPIIPAGATLGPLILAGVLQASGVGALALPSWLQIGAYLVIGAQVGLRFTPELIRNAIGILRPMALASLALIALCGLSGLLLSAILDIDPLTAMLATVPGSIESIAIISIDAQADVGFIMTLQVARLFAVVLAGPPAATLLLKVELARRARNAAPPG